MQRPISVVFVCGAGPGVGGSWFSVVMDGDLDPAAGCSYGIRDPRAWGGLPLPVLRSCAGIDARYSSCQAAYSSQSVRPGEVQTPASAATHRRERGTRSYNWVRTKLQAAGAAPRGKGRGKHRKPSPRAGMMLQQDGSAHEWIPDATWDLIVTTDDATNERYSMFFREEEGVWNSFFRGMREAVGAKGLCCSLYTDRASHYWLMSNTLLPAGAFLISIFIGWVADREGIREELGLADGPAYRLWRVLVRYVVPVAVAAIFIAGVRG